LPFFAIYYVNPGGTKGIKNNEVEETAKYLKE